MEIITLPLTIAWPISYKTETEFDKKGRLICLITQLPTSDVPIRFEVIDIAARLLSSNALLPKYYVTL